LTRRSGRTQPCDRTQARTRLERTRRSRTRSRSSRRPSRRSQHRGASRPRSPSSRGLPPPTQPAAPRSGAAGTDRGLRSDVFLARHRFISHESPTHAPPGRLATDRHPLLASIRRAEQSRHGLRATPGDRAERFHGDRIQARRGASPTSRRRIAGIEKAPLPGLFP
jgi:hypothetical protein